MHPNTQRSATPRRAKAPVALAIAGLLGATALTIPFLTSQTGFITSTAQAATQAAAPAAGFADLVEKVNPAVVSVRVKNGNSKTSHNRHSPNKQFHYDGPGRDKFKRFFDQFGGEFKRQNYDGPGAQDHAQGYQVFNGQGRYQNGYQPRYDRNNGVPNRAGNGFNIFANPDGRSQRYGGYQGQYLHDSRPSQAYSGNNDGNRQGNKNHHRSSQGSGFIISADGYVVTNNHVIENGEKIEITLSDGSTHEAKLIGADPKTDLALLKIESDKTFQFVSFADKPGRVGDWVIAVGNPFGLGGTVTTGIISAHGRDLRSGPYDDYIQIDASINKGNSGGPAFNLDGQVVGVNTAIFSPTGGSVGIGFAIPASIARQVIEDLKDDGRVSRGWLGVQIQAITADIADSLDLDHTKGAIVAQVQADSPAEKAGLKTGDLILQVNGQVVESPKDLARKVAGIDPGTDVEFTIYRDGETVTEKVTLGTLAGNDQRAETPEEKPTEHASLGSLGLDLTTEDGAVVISSVNADGPAAKKGLKAGDRILEIGGQKVTSAEDVEDLIKAMSEKGRKAALILVRTGDSQRFVAIELDRG